MIIYRVKRGDTLASVSRKHGVLPTVLADANAISEDGALTPGQALAIVIPAATHHVREGDTLTSIARRHGIRPYRLLQLNPALGGSDRLYPGMTLTLAPAEPPRATLSVLGYTLAEEPPEALLAALPYLTYLAIDGARIGEDGTPSFPDAEAMIGNARRLGAVPLLVLSAAGAGGAHGEEERTCRLLCDEERTSRLTAALCQKLMGLGYGGVFLDFPFVKEECRRAYLLLISQLRRRLGHGAAVIASHAVNEGAFANGGADFSAVGRAMGGLSLETYDFATRYQEPSPPAPYDKVKSTVAEACRYVRPQKLLLGISTRAQDSAVNQAEGRTLPVRDALVAAEAGSEVNYDPIAKIPYLCYRGESGKRILFFEDAESFYEKLLLLEEYSLGGITLYPTVSLPASLLSMLAYRYKILKSSS